MSTKLGTNYVPRVGHQCVWCTELFRVRVSGRVVADFDNHSDAMDYVRSRYEARGTTGDSFWIAGNPGRNLVNVDGVKKCTRTEKGCVQTITVEIIPIHSERNQTWNS